jgi:hypothetical protein
MSSVFRRSAIGLGIGAAVLLTAAVSLAEIRWDLQPPGTNAYDWTLTQHWRYMEGGAGNSNYGCSASDCSYHPIGESNTFWGGAPNSGAPECLEVTTLPTTTTLNPDTVIEVYDSNANQWKYINDDFGGTYQSHARIWFEGSGTRSSLVRVRAYSSSHNSDDFKITITRRDLTKAACTSGQSSIPWAQISEPTPPTFVLTMSTFH